MQKGYDPHINNTEFTTQARVNENVQRFAELFWNGTINVQELKEMLSRYEYANLYGTKYQDDNGALRILNTELFPENWKKETLNQILSNEPKK